MRPRLPHGVVPAILIVMASVCRPGSSALGAIASIFVVASGEFARLPAAEPIPRTEATHVVINEIHFAPPQKRPLEFVELYNPSSNEVRLAAWTLDKFSFPSTAVIPSGGFAVIAQDPKAFAAEFGFTPLGPLPGKLSHHGEHLTLRDATGAVVEELTYGVGFPWPTAAVGGGSSLERLHPNLPANDPGAWRSAGYPVAPAATGTVFIPVTDPHWRWRKGTAEASSPHEAWRRVEFKEDSSWQTGRTSIGYGDDDDETLVTDMRGRYTSLFLRHSFVIDRGVPLPAQLLLRVRVDDGCVAWINGQEVHRWHVRPGELPFDAVAENHEATDFEEAILPNAASLLRTGTNVLALQVFNASRDSSDLSIDAELRTAEGAPARRHPTPGAPNSVFSTATPPSLLAVDHQPAQPKSGQAVVVTARFREGQSLTHVTLSWQVVEPGRYLRKSDPEYATNWSVAPMRDDGREGDVRAGDGVFTAIVPATWQKHRRLVRYRVRATNAGAVSVSGLQEDDDSPNFAWFVFDGLPAWTGASHPGKTPEVTFSPEFLGTLPAYHLLARSADVAQSQWNGDANRRRFFGTLVYDGRVYDHIQFHNRGSGSAYISGKNKWGLKFNRAHELAARDIHGQRYESTWDSLNLNPGLSTPYEPVHCGIAGLDEAVTFRAFQLAGVLSANTFWVHFRVIDSAVESMSTDQYAGDLHGLDLAVEDMNGGLLHERGFPDGNIYSMQSGRKHLARGAPADGSDWNELLNSLRSDHPASWWRTHLDLPAYYSFHAINRVIANVDLRPDGNHGYYRRSDGRWGPFPWDHDMVLVPRTHQPGHIEAIRCLRVPALRVEYQNRAREVLDLFCADPAPDGGQVGQLVRELGSTLMPAGFPYNWGQLDEAAWNWNPHQHQKGRFYLNPATAHHFGGSWRRTLATPDLAGFCRYIVDFCTDSRPTKNYAPNDGDQRGYGFGFLLTEAKDDNVPAPPRLRSAGPAGGSNGQLGFQVTAFASPRGTNGFGALQWRVAEISAPGRAGFVAGQPWHYELEAIWTSPETTHLPALLLIPAEVCRSNHTYRARARYKDTAGRWGHWSAPVEFVAGR